MMRRGFPSRSAGLVAAAALVGLSVGAAVKSFAFYPLRVTSNSMLPTVAAGDWVAISARRIGSDVPIERGDNVSSSIDSRSLGLLPRAEVLGKVAAVIRKPW